MTYLQSPHSGAAPQARKKYPALLGLCLVLGLLGQLPAMSGTANAMESEMAAPTQIVEIDDVTATVAALSATEISTADVSAKPTHVTDVSVAGAQAEVANRHPNGSWPWWGYRFTRAETRTIASVSLWNAVSGVKGTRLVPYSAVIVGLYSYTWVMTARNAQAMGKCLGISWSGTGLIVNC